MDDADLEDVRKEDRGIVDKCLAKFYEYKVTKPNNLDWLFDDDGVWNFSSSTVGFKDLTVAGKKALQEFCGKLIRWDGMIDVADVRCFTITNCEVGATVHGKEHSRKRTETSFQEDFVFIKKGKGQFDIKSCTTKYGDVPMIPRDQWEYVTEPRKCTWEKVCVGLKSVSCIQTSAAEYAKEFTPRKLSHPVQKVTAQHPPYPQQQQQQQQQQYFYPQPSPAAVAGPMNQPSAFMMNFHHPHPPFQTFHNGILPPPHFLPGHPPYFATQSYPCNPMNRQPMQAIPPQHSTPNGRNKHSPLRMDERKAHIAGLPKDTKEYELKALFHNYTDSIEEIKIVTRSGDAESFAFVTFKEVDDLKRVIRIQPEKILFRNYWPISIKIAKSRHRFNINGGAHNNNVYSRTFESSGKPGRRDSFRRKVMYT